MGDPERLLGSITAGDELERELLASIKKAEPPLGAKDEGWARLSAQIAAVALVSTVHGSAAAAAGTAAPSAAVASTGSAVAPLAAKLLSSKVALGLLVSGVAIGASAAWVHWAGTRHAAPVVAPASARPAAAPGAPRADLAAALPAADPALQLTPSLDTGAKAAPPSADQTRKDRLSAESALLTEARAHLRNGDANAAQQSLNKLRAKFPKGVLRQEREVLAIEVLSARGNKAAARQRAQAFIAAYPESPHSAQLSRFADAP